MRYNYNGKNYNIPDDEVDKLVDKWEISINEACEMWLSDNDKITNEVVEEMTKKAMKNAITQTIHGAKGEKKERKPREKKENPLKKEIISAIHYYFSDNSNLNFTIDKIEVENPEKYINFTSNGRSFTINLVEHREKKEKKAQSFFFFHSQLK